MPGTGITTVLTIRIWNGKVVIDGPPEYHTGSAAQRVGDIRVYSNTLKRIHTVEDGNHVVVMNCPHHKLCGSI